MKICFVFIISMLFFSSAYADDIEVFKTSSGLKPNVLFVFDRSGSMNFDLTGIEAQDNADERGTILQDAFKSLLEANSETINAGLGPFYKGESSGIQWPISDLTTNASDIDSSIPQDSGQTSQTIMDEIIRKQSNAGDTNIVDALLESALYFRGDPVSAGGLNPINGEDFTPWTWDSNDNEVDIESWRAPHPGSYLPADAWKPDLFPGEIQDDCRDFTIGGTVISDRENECDHPKYNRVESCVLVPEGADEWCESRPRTCVGGYDIDGNCNRFERQCVNPYPSPAYNKCTTYEDDPVGNPLWEGADYVSPIAESCQANAIVLLSDGEPSKSRQQDEALALTGEAFCEDLSTSIFTDSAEESKTAGNCAIELARFLANNDQVDSVENSVVKTYTIGFANEGAGQDFLHEIAIAGGGEFFPASNALQLNEAFNSILTAIGGQAESFSTVSVDIDKATFSSTNKVYFSQFEPSDSQSWVGNLKGYFLGPDGLQDLEGIEAVDVTAAGAVFKPESRSFWSSTPDGNSVASGGANENMNPVARNLYTFTDTDIPTGGANLTLDQHLLDPTNTDITDEMLEGADRDVLDWIYDQPMADPLHTQPVTINYENRQVVFSMTNQGFIHAFDASNPTAAGDGSGGEELWAFMPQSLLKNLGKHRAKESSGPHIYGLDGGLTRYLDESDTNDGIVTAGERAILYFGMRRGGNEYFALDVSNPLAPRLMWKLEGGSGQFSHLGQSWSRMALSTMEFAGDNVKVLIFGGGYNPELDGLDTPTESNDMGNDVFIVNAETGALLWNAKSHGNGSLNYAIPSDIAILDMDDDGLADRFYFGDLGGQVWRVDFDSGEAKQSAATLTQFADFGGGDGFHPFFYPPSVAYMEGSTNNFMAVSIGSGSRDNPLRPNSQNTIFVIQDHNLEAGAPLDTSKLPYAKADLFDSTLNDLGSSEPAVVSAAKQLYALLDGWYIDLEPGEKVLEKTTLFNGQLLFTTYSPHGENDTSDVCAASGSIGRLYQMDARDGTPVEFLGGDESEPLSAHDRSKVITTHGIPGSATVIFPQGSPETKVYVGPQEVSSIDTAVMKMLWYSKQ